MCPRFHSTIKANVLQFHSTIKGLKLQPKSVSFKSKTSFKLNWQIKCKVLKFHIATERSQYCKQQAQSSNGNKIELRSCFFFAEEPCCLLAICAAVSLIDVAVEGKDGEESLQACISG